MGYLQEIQRKQMNPYEEMSSGIQNDYGPQSVDLASAFQPNSSMKSAAAVPIQKQSAGPDLVKTATEGATAGAIGGPAAAGITVAGSLLSQYLAQKAADERSKREQLGQVYRKQGDDEQQSISQIMANNARALR